LSFVGRKAIWSEGEARVGSPFVPLGSQFPSACSRDARQTQMNIYF